MTERALINLDWLDYRATAWWLGLLYRRPEHFRCALEELPKIDMVRVGIILFAHALVYSILIATAMRLLLVSGLGFSLRESALDGSSPLQNHAKLFISGIGAGIAFGIIFGITMGIAGGVAAGMAFSIAFGFAPGIAGAKPLYSP